MSWMTSNAILKVQRRERTFNCIYWGFVGILCENKICEIDQKYVRNVLKWFMTWKHLVKQDLCDFHQNWTDSNTAFNNSPHQERPVFCCFSLAIPASIYMSTCNYARNMKISKAESLHSQGHYCWLMCHWWLEVFPLTNSCKYLQKNPSYQKCLICSWPAIYGRHKGLQIQICKMPIGICVCNRICYQILTISNSTRIM